MDPIAKFLLDDHLSETVAVFLSFLGGAAAAVRGFRSWLRSRRVPLAIKDKMIEASRWYIRPSYVTSSPGHWKEPGQVAGLRRPLMPELFNAFESGGQRRILVLGDSGMGKTALLYNVYSEHLKRLRQPYRVSLIELGMGDAVERIALIPAQENTVLLLDALDENSATIGNYNETIRRLNALVEQFYRVVITCRTEFFTEQARPSALLGPAGGVVPAGKTRACTYAPLYIAPLTDGEVRLFLRKRYMWRPRGLRQYRHAKSIVSRIPNIMVRPMLLAYLPYVLTQRPQFLYAYELYEAMIKGWLERRKGGLDPQYNDALKFVQGLAIDLVRNFKRRGGYHTSAEEAHSLATQLRVDLTEWQITGRSLLNRDAEGRYKFSHQSFLEVLVARAITERIDVGAWEETEQAAAFRREIFVNEVVGGGGSLAGFNLEGIDLGRADLRGRCLVATKLREAKMTEALLDGADLSDADLSAQCLSEKTVCDVILNGASLKGGMLQSSHLKNVLLKGADLTGCEMSGMTAENCNFEDAKLLGARLDGVELRECSLARADLRSFRLFEKKVVCHRVDISGAILPFDWAEHMVGETVGEPFLDDMPVDSRSPESERIPPWR